MATYGKPSYWDERYVKDPEPFDWYQRYPAISDKITGNLQKSDHILNVGCGNSRVTEEMYEDGYTSIVNVDISKVVIDQMIQKYKDKTSLGWQVMSITQMDFADHSFDFVFDKGTIDSLLCGENSTSTVHKALKEIYRVLKPGKSFVSISYGQPESRLGYFENPDFEWKIDVDTVAKPTIAGELLMESKEGNHVHYIYTCTKPGI